MPLQRGSYQCVKNIVFALTAFGEAKGQALRYAAGNQHCTDIGGDRDDTSDFTENGLGGHWAALL